MDVLHEIGGDNLARNTDFFLIGFMNGFLPWKASMAVRIVSAKRQTLVSHIAFNELGETTQ
jgi:hypothetical protein